MLNLVVINGGRGAATLIPALLADPAIRVTSIVNAYDDGKSTGEIRRFFGMLGPSDLRKVQELMLPSDEPDFAANQALFRHRYPLDCDREMVLRELRDFAEGRRADLVGQTISAPDVHRALQVFVGQFVDGLAIIEKVTPRPFLSVSFFSGLHRNGFIGECYDNVCLLSLSAAAGQLTSGGDDVKPANRARTGRKWRSSAGARCLARWRSARSRAARGGPRARRTGP